MKMNNKTTQEIAKIIDDIYEKNQQLAKDDHSNIDLSNWGTDDSGNLVIISYPDGLSIEDIQRVSEQRFGINRLRPV